MARDRGEDNVEFPEGASIHQLNLLRRARNALTPSICDIDRYIDTLAIHWNPHDKSNWDPDWVLKWWDANAF